MWLQCKRQVPSAVTCHTKLFPDKFRIKLQSLAAFTWPVPSHPLCQERARVEGNWEKPLKEIVPVLPLLTFHGTLKRRVGRSLNFYLKIENVINDLSLCGQILHPPPLLSPLVWMGLKLTSHSSLSLNTFTRILSLSKKCIEFSVAMIWTFGWNK